MRVSPTSLRFDVGIGDGNPNSESVIVSGLPVGKKFTAKAGQKWLSVTPAEGTDGTGFTAQVQTLDLKVGKYKDVITVEAPDEAAISIPVSLEITE
jgi:hypothetical protein